MTIKKMKRLKTHKHTLHVLKNCNPLIRRTILKSASPELIKTLCEICMNTLNGNAKISGNCKKQLKIYKNPIRKLISPRLGLKTKKKILIQKGGFLPALLGAVLSGIIGNLVERL